MKKEARAAGQIVFEPMADSAESAAERANAALRSMETETKDISDHSLNTIVGDDLELMAGHFEKLKEDVSYLMNEMFLDVTRSLDGLLTRVELASAGIVDNLRAIGSMQTSLASMSAERPALTPAQSKARDERIEAATDSAAVHNPLWYAGSRGYEQLFTAKMNSLISAVNAVEHAQAQQSVRSARQIAAQAQRVPSPGRGVRQVPRGA